MEIGSIYEMNPAFTGKEDTQDRKRFSLLEVQKYKKRYEAYTASGRDAIALALKSLETDRPELSRTCLLPDYMCDTIFFPFERAGWKIGFYHIGKNLEANAEMLGTQIETFRPGLLFIHAYYGLDTWKQMRFLLEKWRKQGVCLMEDVTQSYYLEEAGREADYVVGSLRKWYPVPDGGFVLSDRPLTTEKLSSGEEAAAKRWEVLTGKWNYLHGKKEYSQKEEFLKRNRELETELDERTALFHMSRLSKNLLKKTDEAQCREQRRRNCLLLTERLSGKEQFCPVLSYADYKAAPLYYPIYAKDRDRLQEYLRLHDIYAPVLWPVGAANADFLSSDSRYIFAHLLALPMDQRYGEEEMHRMANVLDGYEKL